MAVIVPPIKSQGIKTKLVPWIKQSLPSYKGKWIEPFMGTGVVAFNLAGQQATLADTNPHIVGFYKKIQNGEISGQKVRAYLEQEDFFLKNSTDFSLSSKLYATYGCSYHHFYTVWSLFRKKDH